MAQARDSQNRIISQMLALVTAQVVTTGAASAQSAAWQATTKVIRITAKVDQWVAFGTNPTAAAATAGSVFMPTGTTKTWAAVQGQKVAAIQDAGAGKCSIEELA
jgi:hypothetical protein